MATDIIARGMITEYIAGTNINFTENRDGTVEISASGSISSEDSVARDAIGNHKSDTSNPHNVTPAQIGLGNVDNTSDLDKPISTAVQKAIDNKADKTVATTSADGLMSAEDKGKLDAFEITTTGGKLHDKDIATTDLIPTELPANGGNADTVNGHSVNADVPADAKFTDTVVDINTMEYTVNFSNVSWATSTLGKFESYITLNNVNKIISINLGNWDNFNPDDIVQALIVGTNIFGFMSNTAKSNGHMTFRITYI